MKHAARFLSCLVLTLLTTACMTPSQRKNASVAPAKDSPVIEAPQTQEGKESDPPSQVPQAKQSTPLKTVRVLLAENQSSASIKHSAQVYVYTKNLDKKYKISAEGTLSIRALGNAQVQAGTLKTNQPIILEPAKGTLLTWNNNIYAGKIFIVPAKNSFLLVEHVDLENYLYGVLPYEMNYSWPLEALKAQAVAARTYTLKTLENVRNKNFDLYSDVRSQMYKGGGKQYDSVKKAVDGTRGKVLTYNHALFYTYYHGNCGGGTDDVRSWNFGAASLKPLSGASCAYDKHSKSFTWQMNVPAAKVMAYAKTVGLTGTLKNVQVASKTSTGRATYLTIHSSKGSKKVSCPKFRLSTGIRSCKITRISTSGQQVRFEGKGYGHGVGMCQDGANGMAQKGKTYEQILKNYYPGATITQLK